MPILSRVLRHPFIAAAITLLLIGTGVAGSIYSPEIRRAYPFTWSYPPWSFSAGATTFWLLVIACTCLFYARQRAEDDARELAQRVLVERSQTLEQLIRTLPPANFLGLLAQILSNADKIMDVLTPLNEVDRDDLVQGLRQLLNLIARLAQSFDGDDQSVHYGANIMLVKYADLLSDEQKTEIQQRLLFTDPETSVDQLLGVLDLDAELSATAADAAAHPDPDLASLALPLPVTAQTETGRYRVLPGAPIAYFTRQADGFTDTDDLRRWCDTEGDFTNAVKDELQNYFRDAAFRSFLSIPLFASPEATDQLNEEPMAILNIHCDRVGLLAHQGEPASHFVSVIRQFQLDLAKLLRKFVEFDETSKEDASIVEETKEKP
jgi:hypothetical protein